MRVIVIGAGVIGASTAWHLSRAGAQVTVIDGGLPAASAASFGWINASFFADEAHHRLRVEGIAAYQRLLRDAPELPVAFAGALWWEEQGASLHAFKEQLRGLGYRVDALGHDAVAALEPALTALPMEVLRFPDEGAAEPATLAAALIAASGAQVIRGARVASVSGADRIDGVQTDLGFVPAERVVVAAGNGSPEIVRGSGVNLPMLRRPGVMVMSKHLKARIAHVLVTPHGEVRQLPDGRLMASAVANHQGDDADELTETPDAIVKRLLAWLDPMIAGEDVAWGEVTVAFRPVPRDGLPVIGAAGPDGLHLAVMHSGVTLAGVAGEITAAEVIGQATNAQLDLVAPYRPERFQ